jgi:hypothetical protein
VLATNLHKAGEKSALVVSQFLEAEEIGNN